MPDGSTPESLEPQGPAPRRYMFEWRKVGVVQAVSREFLEDHGIPPGVQDVDVTVAEDLFADRMIARLRSWVLTHQLAEHEVIRTRTVEWPATPWQHWKQRHAEAWWLRWFVARRPVRMQEQVVDFREAWQELAAYPWQERLPLVRSLGRPVRMVQVLATESGDIA